MFSTLEIIGLGAKFSCEDWLSGSDAICHADSYGVVTARRRRYLRGLGCG